MDEEPKRLVVRRPDPPPDDDERVPRLADRTRLTPEEARALVSVATVPKGPWDKVKPRLRNAFIATTFVSVAMALTVGHSWVVEILLFLGAIAWVAWPLFSGGGRDDWA